MIYLFLLVLFFAVPAHAQQVGSFPPATVPYNGTELTYCIQNGADHNCDLNDIWKNPGLSCPSIMLHGGDATGLVDNSAALRASLAASTCVSFPAGKFLIASPFSYVYPSTLFASVTLIGAGANQTQIIGPANNSLFTFTFENIFNSFHMQDMSLISTSACSTCTALSLVQGVTVTGGYTGQSDIVRVNVTGSDPSNNIPSGVNYWETGISAFGISNINFDGLYIQGIQNSSGPTPGTSRGIYIFGDANHVPVAFNLTNSDIYLYQRGIEIGPWVQGVTITGGSNVGNFFGIYQSGTFGQGGAQLALANTTLNDCEDVLTTSMYFVSITGTTFIAGLQPFACGSNTAAVELDGASDYATITGNTFGGNNVVPSAGIHTASNNIVAATISGNIFNDFSVAVYLTGPASGVTVANNVIANSVNTAIGLAGLGSPVADVTITGNVISGSNVGISLLDNNVSGVTIADNKLVGNTTDFFNNTGSFSANRVDIPQSCVGAGNLSFGGSITGIAFSNQYCTYTVHGNDATVQFDYTLSSKGSATGAAVLFVPPAATVGTNFVGSASIGTYQNMASLTGAVTGNVSSGQSAVALVQEGASAVTALTDTNFTPTTRIAGTVSYKVP